MSQIATATKRRSFDHLSLPALLIVLAVTNLGFFSTVLSYVH
jgi:hypothetical protein